MRFVWDAAKSRANSRKHGISFEQARELFRVDSDAIDIFDERHSIDEDRFVSIGVTSAGLVVAVWTEPEDGVVRIISARPATTREAALYRRFVEGWRP